MSVIAIHPRTPSPSGPGRTPTRRRPLPADVATLRLTLEVPLAGERLPGQLALLLELARDLADQGAGTLAVTGLAGPVSEPRLAATVAPHLSADPGDRPAADGSDRGRITADGSDRGRITDGGPGVGRSVAGAAGRSAVHGPASDSAYQSRLRILPGPRTVLRDGLSLPLTRLEFDLLLFLARHPRRVFTRTQLLASVWGYQHAVARTVDVHVRRLRAKVGEDTPLVTTVHGVGYRLADDARVRVEDPEWAVES